MDKLEFEQAIKNVLIKAEFLKEGQIVSHAVIIIDILEIPKVELIFHAAE